MIKRFLPLLVVVCLFLSIIHSAVGLAKAATAQSIEQPAYVYVQTDSGLVQRGKAVDPLHREEGVLKRFAEEFVDISYTWPKNGPGMKDVGLALPYSMYTQSFKIVPGIREEWLKTQAVYFVKSKDPMTNYIRKSLNTKVTVTGSYIENVKPEHEWDVRVFATQLRFDGQNNIIAKPLKVNKLITLKAMNDYQPDWAISDNELGRIIDKSLHSGLRIVNIIDL